MGNRMRGFSIVIGSLLLWSANSAAEEIILDKALVGTIWVTQSPYTWTKIDCHGRVLFHCHAGCSQATVLEVPVFITNREFQQC